LVHAPLNTRIGFDLMELRLKMLGRFDMFFLIVEVVAHSDEVGRVVIPIQDGHLFRFLGRRGSRQPAFGRSAVSEGAFNRREVSEH
jgi:hypothetical protein